MHQWAVRGATHQLVAAQICSGLARTAAFAPARVTPRAVTPRFCCRRRRRRRLVVDATVVRPVRPGVRCVRSGVRERRHLHITTPPTHPGRQIQRVSYHRALHLSDCLSLASPSMPPSASPSAWAECVYRRAFRLSECLSLRLAQCAKGRGREVHTEMGR